MNKAVASFECDLVEVNNQARRVKDLRLLYSDVYIIGIFILINLMIYNPKNIVS